MKYRNLLVVLLVGIFVVSGTVYGMGIIDTLDRGDATETHEKGDAEKGINPRLGGTETPEVVASRLASLEQELAKGEKGDTEKISEDTNAIINAFDFYALGGNEALNNQVGSLKALASSDINKAISHVTANRLLSRYNEAKIIRLPASGVLAMTNRQKEDLYNFLNGKENYIVTIVAYETDKGQFAKIINEFKEIDKDIEPFLGITLAFAIMDNEDYVTKLGELFDPKMPLTDYTLESLKQITELAGEQV